MNEAGVVPATCYLPYITMCDFDSYIVLVIGGATLSLGLQALQQPTEVHTLVGKTLYTDMYTVNPGNSLSIGLENKLILIQ